MRKSILYSLLISLCLSCGDNPEEHSHEHPHGSDYAHQLKDLKKIDAGHGEHVYHMEGKDYEMKGMSIAITETEPGGGPPLHVHETDEAHVVMNGSITYVIGDSIFKIDGPYVANVPAGTPHTFINSGDSTLNLIAVFPQDNFGTYKPIGKNPLWKETPHEH